MGCCNSNPVRRYQVSDDIPSPEKKDKGYSILDLAKEALSGSVDMATDDTKSKRLEVCKRCVYLIKLPIGINGTGNCGKCGCFVDAKVKFAKSSCPIGKW